MSKGKRIKEVREAVGMTQSEFAEAIGKSQVSISQNEQDKTTPRVSTLNSIIKEFGVSREWIYTGDGEMFDVVAESSESDLSTPWSERAHDALKAQNDQLLVQVTFLQDMLRKAMSGIGEANFQNDIVLAGVIVEMNENVGNIVRVAA